MASNYPPGVTGREYEIAGPDFEVEREDIECPNGHSPCLVQGYRSSVWAYCFDEDCKYEQMSFDIPLEEYSIKG